MQVTCYPARLQGDIRAIPSKSYAHRILICAALADKPTRVVMDTRLSEDIAATAHCLSALGATFAEEDGALIVTPISECPKAPILDCGESGSTLRFLLPVVAALGCGAVFTGSGKLPQRPIGPLVKALRAGGGVSIDNESLPLKIEGKLSSLRYTLPGNISSQFITGLLLAFTILPDGGEIILENRLESAAYVDMTLNTLSAFLFSVESTKKGFAVPAGQKLLSPAEIAVEGDWSNIAFFLTAGAFGGPVTCRELSLKSLQGDLAITELLSRFGAKVKRTEDYIETKAGKLTGIEIDARQIPDLVPILAVIASVSTGKTKIGGAARLRIKESDRLKTVRRMLENLGGKVEEGDSFLLIEGQENLRGGIVDCCGDHRIAMAAAVAATVCREKTVLVGAESVAKSYPRFFEDYKMLGGNCDVINDR
ncbi:MAG: 3-phosphoshikimate 1-carboxyvinyltransferase [Eubacteriales bacterium]|nr:3-phosphoshikimate 1-carboxyvinyltransferase [Eubacteriales bacterium]MDD4390752.1 3-phosphoshikimate 1-carboxyvinyltransferase [Eubacteriales bacterium]